MALKVESSNFGIQHSSGGRRERMNERESTLFSTKEIRLQPLTSLPAIDSLIQLCLLISLQASLSIAVDLLSPISPSIISFNVASILVISF